MTHKEFNQLVRVEICPEEALSTLHSVKGLILIVERHQNHPETYHYLNLISMSLTRLEGQINLSKTKS